MYIRRFITLGASGYNGIEKKFIFVVAEKILHYNNPTPKHTVCFISKKEI